MRRVCSVIAYDALGRVLLGRRASGGTWNLPGGKYDPSESPLETAARELWEEAGLKPAAGEKFEPVVDKVLRGASSEWLHLHVFKCRVETPPTNANDPDGEFDHFMWVKPSEPLPNHIRLTHADDLGLQYLGLAPLTKNALLDLVGGGDEWFGRDERRAAEAQAGLSPGLLSAVELYAGVKITSGVLEYALRGDDSVLDALMRYYGLSAEAKPDILALAAWADESRPLRLRAGLTKAEPQKLVVGRSGEPWAAMVEVAFAKGDVRQVNLQGKQTKQAELIKYGDSLYLIKYDTGRKSPSAGFNDISASMPRREAVCAAYFKKAGIDRFYPQAGFVEIGGAEAVVMDFLPLGYNTVQFYRGTDDYPLITRIFDEAVSSGVLWQWSAMDYVLGNADRHANNIMVELTTRQIKLIDQGVSLCGTGFSPAKDPASFIPFYLRYNAQHGFSKAPPDERIKSFPEPSLEAEAFVRAWLGGLAETDLRDILADYGIPHAVYTARLSGLKDKLAPAAWLNRFWAGLIP